MSDLQLGLIVVGILVVAGVYAFNRFQELQLRRRVESRFAHPPDDVLMEQPAARAARAEDERIEPSLGGPGAESEITDPVAVRAEPALDTTEVDEPVEVAAAEPESTVAMAAATAAMATETDGASSPPTSPGAPPAASAIDYVCSIETPGPIESRALDAFVRNVEAIGKPVSLYGWNAHAGAWVALRAGSGTPATRVQASLQLADRAGAVNRVQLSSLRDLSLQLAERAGGACRCGDIDQAAKAAAEIDRFCSQVDVSIGCNLVPRSGASFPGTKVRGLLESAGFALEPSGRFVLRAEDGSILLSAEDIEGEALNVERLRSGALAGLTLSMDVPRASGGPRLFERMIELARHLAHALDAKVVDDNRVELTEAGLKVIRQQLKSVHSAMEAQGIPAGGALAARLFS